MKTKSNIGKILLVVFLSAIIVGGLGFGAWYLVNQSGLGGLTPSGDCEIEPYIDVVVTDTINPGTSVTGAIPYARVNGEYRSGITTGNSGDTFVVGDKIDVVVNGTGYIDKLIEGFEIKKCGANKLTTSLTKLDGSPSAVVYYKNTEMTNDASGGANNVSTSATPITLDLEWTIPTDEGVEQVVFVVEDSNSTEVDKITMTTSEATKVSDIAGSPDNHAQEGNLSDSLFRTITFDNIADDGATTNFDIVLDPETGITMGTGTNTLYITWYISQAFNEVDGTLKVGIVDSDGTAKHVSEATGDYDVKIGNAV